MNIINPYQIDTSFIALTKMLDLEKVIEENFKKQCPIRYWLYKKTKLKVFFTTTGFHIEIYPSTDINNIGRSVYQLKLKKTLIKEVII